MFLLLCFSMSMGLRPEEVNGRREKGGNGTQERRTQTESIEVLNMLK